METTIITVDQTISTALESQNVTKKVLADLKQYKELTIAGLEDKAGYEAVHKARMVCKSTRVLAQKICKAGREEAVKTQKAWIAKEKEIVEEIELTENYLQEQQDKIDAEKERIENEKKEAERLRIQSRIDKLSAVGYALDFEVVSTITDEEFEATLTEATRLHEEEQAKIAEAKRLEEEERERIRLQGIEQEKERKRLEAIEREQQEREAKIKAEQEEAERKIREEREAIEREKAAIAREKELETARKEAAEKALKQEAERKEREEKERVERERKLAEENARTELLKPIKERLTKWVDSISIPPIDIEHDVVDNISDRFHDFKHWAFTQINSIK